MRYERISGKICQKPAIGQKCAVYIYGGVTITITKMITKTITITITKTIFNDNDNEVLRFASCGVPLRPGRLTAPLLVNSYISDKPITVRRGGGVWADNQINFLDYPHEYPLMKKIIE